MPALEALLPRLSAAHTLPCGVSVDTNYSHGAWGHALGGVSFPLLADFHPKGEVAASYGVYLSERGICDRATVIVDAGGTVRYASSVTPAGKRDVDALVRFCEELDAEWEGDLPPPATAPGMPSDAVLYVKDRCMFSRWTAYARTNLHLEDQLPIKNVSQDAAAAAELQQRAGKTQAPALAVDGRVMFESEDIIRELVSRAAPPLLG